MKLGLKLAGLFGRGAAHNPVTSRAVRRLAAPAPNQSAELDGLLIWSAVALLLFGWVMVYSASIATAEGLAYTGHQSTFYLVRHGVFLAVGTLMGVVAFQMPMRAWQQLSPHLFIGGIVLLTLVIVPGVGREVNGASRWLPFGPVNFQPSEAMKLFVALYAADSTVRKLPHMQSFKRAFLPMAGVSCSIATSTCCIASTTALPATA